MTCPSDLIAEVRRLDAEATAGPWSDVQRDDPRGQPVGYYRGLVVLVQDGLSVVSDGREVSVAQWEPNARLIAHYRNAAPALADECERLAARVVKLEAELAWLLNSSALEEWARGVVRAALKGTSDVRDE